MFERIDPRSPTPIYAQIAARVRVAVAAGELRSGDGLPSVRQLSGSLRVNPATVVQAYRELEAEGMIEMRQGSGTFVRSMGPERRASERLLESRRLVRELLGRAAALGLTASDLRMAFDDEFPGEGR
ncbi:MAG: GntR family transcriptional regulator [Gemmatimonadota bacterium]|nr:GntR family transcriptional regulator [Gemmatimonadota bacterium]